MVIAFFDFDGGGGHEAESVGKVGESVFAVKFFVLDAPARKFLQRSFKLSAVSFCAAMPSFCQRALGV